VENFLDRMKNLTRDFEFEQQRRFTVTLACEDPIQLPHIVGRKLSQDPNAIFYRCLGCPEWHIRESALPEGVTKKGFVALMRKLHQRK